MLHVVSEDFDQTVQADLSLVLAHVIVLVSMCTDSYHNELER